MPRRSGRPKHPIERATLLAAARRAFSERGYEGASLAEIAQATGLRKASLLHRFGSKDGLYDEMFVQILTDLAALLPPHAADAPRWLDALDALGDRVVDYLGTHPEVARLLLREIVGSGTAMRRPAGEGVTLVLAATDAFFAQGVATGAIPAQPTAALTLGIIAQHLVWFASADVASGLTGDPFTADAIAARKAVVRTFVRRACGAPPGSPA